jgi:hypothetical protein
MIARVDSTAPMACRKSSPSTIWEIVFPVTIIINFPSIHSPFPARGGLFSPRCGQGVAEGILVNHDPDPVVAHVPDPVHDHDPDRARVPDPDPDRDRDPVPDRDPDHDPAHVSAHDHAPDRARDRVPDPDREVAHDRAPDRDHDPRSIAPVVI